jgi:signal transduction histidine kinase
MENLTPTNILIVDDRPENISALRSLIASEDVRTHSASNADEALEILIQENFGLALLDVQMPVVSGFDLARLIRGVQRYRNLPIIFVTAQAQDQETIFEGYETGAVDVLFKPLNPHTVRSKVRVFVELDRQKRMLEKLKKDAEAATLAKSRFLANMSHEIRTPLSAVLGFADLIAQGDLQDDERLQFASAVKRNGDLLKRLIDDILDLSKLEANKIEVENIKFDLSELFSDIEKTLTLKASEKGISLRFHQPQLKKRHYRGDPSRLKQILLNLAGNAIKFTSQGSVEISARIQSANSSQDNLKIQVKDSGVGMSKEQAARIFQPFMQADSSTSRKFGGTGLGLSISREIARAMDGNIHLISSQPGVGSIFEASVLLKVEPSSLLEAPSDSEIQVSPLPQICRRAKVLVIDDSQDNLILVQMYLKQLNLDLRMVSSGVAALSLIQKEEFDLVLMDIQMPEMDGFETTQKIRAMGFQRPIVALTAFFNTEDLRKCIQSGCDDVLTKPLDRDELVQKLTALLAPQPETEKAANPT